MESYIGNNSCRIDKAPIKNYDMYILRFDDTTLFSSPQEVFLKQKQYIIDINPIQIGFPKKNHCSKAESQHHILFFCGLNWSLLCNNRSFFKGSESAVYLRGQVDSLLWHTVDGSEIPFPTVWMFLKPVVNNGIFTILPYQLVRDFFHQRNSVI